jgi:hypothetical protein
VKSCSPAQSTGTSITLPVIRLRGMLTSRLMAWSESSPLPGDDGERVDHRQYPHPVTRARHPKRQPLRSHGPAGLILQEHGHHRRPLAPAGIALRRVLGSRALRDDPAQGNGPWRVCRAGQPESHKAALLQQAGSKQARARTAAGGPAPKGGTADSASAKVPSAAWPRSAPKHHQAPRDLPEL